MKLHTFLKEKRISLDYPQNFVAKKLNISAATLSRWESGVTIPNWEDTLMILQFYGHSDQEAVNLLRGAKE